MRGRRRRSCEGGQRRPKPWITSRYPHLALARSMSSEPRRRRRHSGPSLSLRRLLRRGTPRTGCIPESDSMTLHGSMDRLPWTPLPARTAPTVNAANFAALERTASWRRSCMGRPFGPTFPMGVRTSSSRTIWSKRPKTPAMRACLCCRNGKAQHGGAKFSIWRWSSDMMPARTSSQLHPGTGAAESANA